MSKARTLGLPGAFLALLGFVLLPAVTVFAQAGDPLGDAAQKKQIAAQKLEEEVKQALTKVRDVQKKNPQEALVILQTYKGIIENDDNLTDQRRGELVNYLSQRIRQLQTSASALPKEPVNPPALTKQDLSEKYASGKSSSSGPYGTAKKTYESLKGPLTKAQQIKLDTEKGYQVALEPTELSNLPANGYMSYPRDWKKKMEIRDKFTGPTLSAQEVKLLKTLNSVLTVDFDNWKFKEAIKYLQDKAGVTIAIDPNSMKEASVEYDSPVTFQPGEKVQVRTILKQVLGQVGLAYILKEGIIQVVTPQVARETMVVRSYPIRDLLPVADPRLGPSYNMARARYYAFQTIQMIVNTVEPASWAANGGKGTIWFDPTTQSIVIRNSAELHISAAAGIYR